MFKKILRKSLVMAGCLLVASAAQTCYGAFGSALTPSKQAGKLIKKINDVNTQISEISKSIVTCNRSINEVFGWPKNTRTPSLAPQIRGEEVPRLSSLFQEVVEKINSELGQIETREKIFITKQNASLEQLDKNFKKREDEAVSSIQALNAGIKTKIDTALKGCNDSLKKIKDALDSVDAGLKGKSDAVLKDFDTALSQKQSVFLRAISESTKEINSLFQLLKIRENTDKAERMLVQEEEAEKEKSSTDLSAVEELRQKMQAVLDSNAELKTQNEALLKQNRTLEERVRKLETQARETTQGSFNDMCNEMAALRGELNNLKESVPVRAEIEGISGLGNTFFKLDDALFKDKDLSNFDDARSRVSAATSNTSKPLTLTGVNEDIKKLKDFLKRTAVEVNKLKKRVGI